MRRLLAATFPDDLTIVTGVHREVQLLDCHRPIDFVRRAEIEPVLGVLASAYTGAFVRRVGARGHSVAVCMLGVERGLALMVRSAVRQPMAEVDSSGRHYFGS